MVVVTEEEYLLLQPGLSGGFITFFVILQNCPVTLTEHQTTKHTKLHVEQALPVKA